MISAHLPTTEMDQKLLILLLLHNIMYAWSSPRLAALMNKREVFCGDRLTQTLALLCRGVYNSPASKKSLRDWMGYNEYDEYLPSDDDDDNRLDFPFLRKDEANTLMERMRRSKITKECCDKSCSRKHLSLYCG